MYHAIIWLLDFPLIEQRILEKENLNSKSSTLASKYIPLQKETRVISFDLFIIPCTVRPFIHQPCLQ